MADISTATENRGYLYYFIVGVLSVGSHTIFKLTHMLGYGKSDFRTALDCKSLVILLNRLYTALRVWDVWDSVDQLQHSTATCLLLKNTPNEVPQ